MFRQMCHYDWPRSRHYKTLGYFVNYSFSILVQEIKRSAKVEK